MTLTGKHYRCSAGEMFDLIALVIYGSEKYTPDLLAANPEYCMKQVFEGGEVLEIPYVMLTQNNPGAVTMTDVAPWKG